MAKATKKATVKQTETEDQTSVAYRITAKRDGFRRARIVHAGTREYSADELTQEQLAAIEAEPLLILERLEVPETEAPSQEQGAGI